MKHYLELAMRSLKSPQRGWNVIAVFCALVLIVAALLWAGWNRVEFKPVLVLLALVSATILAYLGIYLCAPRLDSALLDTHYERFRRLEGLFNAIPASIRNNRVNASLSESFESLCDKLEGWVDEETRDFKPNDAPDFVHNLNLLFLQIVPQEYLLDQLDAIRREYRDAFGAAVYESHIAAVDERLQEALKEKDTTRMVQLLRAEATYLTNETRRHSLLEQHVESTRQKLMRAALRSWWYNVIPFLAVLIFFLFCKACVEHAVVEQASTDWSALFAKGYLIKSSGTVNGTAAYQVLIAAAMLSLVGIAGATGGMLSVIQRVQTADGNVDAGADLRALIQSEASVFFAPVTGVMFSLILSAMFIGGMVKGAMFPELDTHNSWFMSLWNGEQLAKWLVWGFLAGFSERLVPDMLNGVVKDAKERPAAERPASSQAAVSMALQLSQETAKGDEDAAVVNPLPVLYSHAGSIPPDAKEVTVTGEGFSASTELTLDGSTMHPDRLQVTPNSITFKVEPLDYLKGKSKIEVVVKNPPPGGGDSHALTILIDETGG